MPLPWDHNARYHNASYHPHVLRRLPSDAGRGLDLGCGAGLLAARLAERVPVVDAVDVDPRILAVARSRTPANVTCTSSDALAWLREHPSTYDVVVSVSALHHLPLAEALGLMGAALRPGGVLLALTHTRTDLPRELGREVAATTVHHAIGAGLAVRERVTGRRHLLRRELDGPDGAPMRMARPDADGTPDPGHRTDGAARCARGVPRALAVRADLAAPGDLRVTSHDRERGRGPRSVGWSAARRKRTPRPGSDLTCVTSPARAAGSG